jgi:hypothetical protein
MNIRHRQSLAALAAAACLAALGAVTAPATAGPATVTFSAQNTGALLADPGSAPLSASSIVRLGYFSLTVQQITDGMQDMNLLDANFHELAHAKITYFGGSTVLNSSGVEVSRSDGVSFPGAEGLFAHDVSLDATALGLLSTRPFLWALNAATPASSTEHAIFSDASWALPAFGSFVMDIGDLSTLDASDVYLALRGPLDPEKGAPNLLTPVPEPSSALMLAALGLTATIARRSRKTAQPIS